MNKYLETDYSSHFVRKIGRCVEDKILEKITEESPLADFLELFVEGTFSADDIKKELKKCGGVYIAYILDFLNEISSAVGTMKGGQELLSAEVLLSDEIGTAHEDSILAIVYDKNKNQVALISGEGEFITKER